MNVFRVEAPAEAHAKDCTGNPMCCWPRTPGREIIIIVTSIVILIIIIIMVEILILVILVSESMMIRLSPYSAMGEGRGGLRAGLSEEEAPEDGKDISYPF